MIVEMQEFMNEPTQALAHQARKFRKNPVGFMRKALVDSAETFKSLKNPVRVVGHSGVKLTAVSQKTLQSLIELESEVITSALSGAAKRFEHAARAEDLLDLVRHQTATLPATRDRIVDEATRGVAIFKDAGHEVRKLTVETYEKVFVSANEPQPKAKATRARKAKRVVRTARGAATKTGVRAPKLAA